MKLELRGLWILKDTAVLCLRVHIRFRLSFLLCRIVSKPCEVLLPPRKLLLVYLLRKDEPNRGLNLTLLSSRPLRKPYLKV